MVELNEIEQFLDENVILKWNNKEREATIIRINSDLETFSYLYLDKKYISDDSGTAHRNDVYSIDGRTFIFYMIE